MAELELELVTNESQIQQTISEFNAQAGVNRDRALSIVRQTSLWVYDEEECVFGPSKFVGYRSMTFATYERALREHDPKFDGNLAKRAIETTLLMGDFSENIGFHEALLNWGEALLGIGVFDTVDQAKWQFLSLYPSRRYWAFLANPTRYRVTAAVRELTEDYWTIRDKDVEKGDRVVIWKAKGKDHKRGIIALAEVIGSPETVPLPMELAKYFFDQRITAPQRRVRVRYCRAPKLPLWLEDSPLDSELRRLTVSRATGGSVFKIPLKHWVRLVKLAGGWPKDDMTAVDENSETRVVSSDDTGEANGTGLLEEAEKLNGSAQGFVVNSEIRKAIERAAVDRAKSYFRQRGFVEIEEHGKPFDLLCRDKQGQVLFVEAKGTITRGDAIFVTANEIEHAKQNPNTALYVLSDLVIDTTGGSPVLSGGTETVYWPWNIEKSGLKALIFRYELKANAAHAKAKMQETTCT